MGITMAVLTVALLCLPGTASAAPRDAQSLEFFLVQARSSEAQGDWESALYYYGQYLGRERNNPQVKQAAQVCARNYYRIVRHLDSSFQYQVRKLEPTQGEAFYVEVVNKVHEHYVDQNKAGFDHLYREGVHELQLALQDKDFCNKYIPETHQKFIPDFVTWLSKQRAVEVGCGQKREKLVRAVSDLAENCWRSLRLRRALVWVEFACGACSGLDEYTGYISLGTVGSWPEKSVTESRMVENAPGVGYIRVTHFQKNTAQEMKTALDALRMQGLQVLLLDLQGNAGGLVDEAAKVAELFLPKGTVIATQSGKKNREYRSENESHLAIPVFVLVDGQTASAAELVAGALKSREATTLIGQTTFGKNWIQHSFRIDKAPHGMVLVTWAQFFVQDVDLSKGIVPGYAVEVGGGMDNSTYNMAVQKAKMHFMMMMQ